MRALIIDDQATAREDLRALLEAHPAIQIVGEANSVDSARLLLARDDYDLVFLDIHIIGGTGFDLMPQVRAGTRVIFATAHDAFALRAFEVNALDYLLKPVRATRLAEALTRLALPAAPPATARPRLRPSDIVHLNSGASSRFAPLANVSAIEAQENYSLVHLADGSRVLVRQSLKAWEEVLPENFARVHRTTMVNLERVTGSDRQARALTLHLSGVAAPVSVSRLSTPEVKAQLQARFPEM